MKKVISENDYERYRILVPVKFFMNGKRKKYISSQLEKLHPCFSDSFCFDSKFALSKKGILANVVVMDKLKLWDYKANYPGLMLTCEEKGSGFVFVGKKTKALLTSLFCVPLLGILFINPFNPLKNADKKSSNEQITAVFDESEKDKEIEIVNIPFAYERFFESLENQSGKIDSLNWKYDGFTENLAVSVKDCYPDAFSDSIFSDFSSGNALGNAQKASFSSVNYANDVPSFSMGVSNRRTADFGIRALAESGNQVNKAFELRAVLDGDQADKKLELRTLDEIDNQANGTQTFGGDFEIGDEGQSFTTGDFRANIRDLLKQNSIKITSENYAPYKIRFQITEKNISDGILDSVEGVSRNAGWSVNEVVLSVITPYSADMEISFTEDFCYSAEKSILFCVTEGREKILMKKAEKKEQKNPPAINTPEKLFAMSEKRHLDAGDRKLGTITHANGEKVVFYKSAKGAIIND